MQASERTEERDLDFWAELEEENARAAAAAARTRDEIALLRQIEAVRVVAGCRVVTVVRGRC